MKKMMAVMTFVLFAGLVFYIPAGNAQTSGYGGSYCPWCGQYVGPQGGYGMGPGMMGGYGYGMGPGMMGGYGRGYGMMQRGYGQGYGMGPGMMGGYGYGMGPGMMGRGYGYGQQYGGQYGPQYQQPQKPLDENEAKEEVEGYLKSTRNPNLKIGDVQEKGNDYEINIVTKDGSLVDKILVNKETGWMRPAY